ncbi:hypothetical protein N431DRAFT_475638 [Stipitochalara longipes BDJ]|nr:hypothetical protein N431DRAFT_475638 [Stipitochalara longipes BDJ]
MERGFGLFEKEIMQNDFNDHPIQGAEWQASTMRFAARLQPVPTKTRASQGAYEIRAFMAKIPVIAHTDQATAIENDKELEKALLELCESAINFVLLIRSDSYLHHIEIPSLNTAYNKKKHTIVSVEGEAGQADFSQSTIVCTVVGMLVAYSRKYGRRHVIGEVRVVVN